MDTFPVLGVPITVTTMDEVVDLVNRWVSHPVATRLITFSNVHMVVEASMHPKFRRMLQAMDLNCPDGYPVYWLAHSEHGDHAEKISGPDFMNIFCEQSAALGYRHFVYGGAPDVARLAAENLQKQIPGIQIAGHYCPPFRALTKDEMDEIGHRIEDSGADLVWVCLGCPKQEKWMHEMRSRLSGKVVLAVGQAVDIWAGRTERAPEFLVRHGLEWTFRLFKEPRRLWKRYLVTNLLFMLLIARDRLRRKSRVERNVIVD